MPIQRSNEPDAFASFERSGWNAVTDGYVKAIGPVTAQSVDAMLDAAKVTKGCRMLDVCTGHGVLAAAAAERGANVSAVDFAESMVAIVHRNVPNVDCRRGDAQDLPFGEGTFDAVVCGYGILHVAEPDRALAEMHRVLHPGGHVAISVWERPSSNNGFGILFGAVKAHGRLDVPVPHGPDIFQFGDLENMTAALAEVGFDDVSAKTVAQTWRLASASGLVDAFLQGAVRPKALLMAQDQDALSAIKAAVAQDMERLFRSGNSFQVPMPAIIGSGAKPSAR
jgi:SAM-dependent methyltransferase